MVFRNDDLSYLTAVNQFEEVHKLFKKYIVLHTVAVIAKDIQKNQPLIDFINSSNIDVQVHAWEHYDFTLNHDKLRVDLPKAVKAITKYFNHAPTVLYPPWNKSDEIVEQIAKENGLTVSNKKVSLSQFTRFKGNVTEDVINFHSWALSELVPDENGEGGLENALKLYTLK